MGPRVDLPSRIELDHDRLRMSFAEVQRAKVTDRAARFRELVAELARHETIEGLVLHPAVREELPDGPRLAARRTDEERDLERRLAAFDRLDPASEEFTAGFEQLRHEVFAHSDAEETEVLPRLEEHCSARRLQELGERYLALKALAPTRPHPDARESRLGNLLVGPVAGVFERVRVALTPDTGSAAGEAAEIDEPTYERWSVADLARHAERWTADDPRSAAPDVDR